MVFKYNPITSDAEEACKALKLMGTILKTVWEPTDYIDCAAVTTMSDLFEIEKLTHKDRGQKHNWVYTLGALWNPILRTKSEDLWNTIPGEKITIAIYEAHLPNEILENAMASGELLRSLVAMRKDLPRHFQERLAEDPESSVRKLIRLNKNVDEDLRVIASLRN